MNHSISANRPSEPSSASTPKNTTKRPSPTWSTLNSYPTQVHTQERGPPVSFSFWENTYEMSYCHEVVPSLVGSSSSSSDSFSTRSAVSSDDESSYFTAPTYPPSTPQRMRRDNISTMATTTTKTTTRTSRNTDAQKIKYKTTLCKPYGKTGKCRFGDNCGFAHGKDEIRIPTLFERHDVNLLDKETFCTRPCMYHVAAGACPMYERCHAIHDPAVEGPLQKTLRLKELGREINANNLHQHQMATLHNGSPLCFTLPVSSTPSQIKNGDHAYAISNDDVAWDSLYACVCNIPQDGPSMNASYKGMAKISEKHKLEIVVMMRGNTPENGCFKYQPTHIACVTQFGIPCMLKNTCAFQVQGQLSTGEIRAIPLHEYDELNKYHIIAQEIAFGTINDPKVHDYAIWFNLPRRYLVPCSEEEAKDFTKNQANTDNSVHPTEQINHFVAHSSCLYFYLNPTLDIDAFNLQTDILHHRLQSLTCNDIENVAALSKREQQLKERFVNLKKHWIAWSWPINSGREDVDKNTKVLPVQVMYSHPIQKHNPNLQEGKETERLWSSFISTMQGNKPPPNKSRLPIFEALAEEVEITPPSVKAETINDCPLDYPFLNKFKKLIEDKYDKVIQSD